MENRNGRGSDSYVLSDFSLAMEIVTPELDQLLKNDKDIAAFFRFVERNDLREEALALLEAKMDEMD